MLRQHAAGYGPVEGGAHDQDQSFETIRLLYVALHEAKAQAFENGEDALDPRDCP